MPIALMKSLIEIYVPDNGLVLDPFMGTGTTGLAAIEAGRRFIGIEINQYYVDIAARRRFEEKFMQERPAHLMAV
jgi:site-specific DNA-methyltransferase (adenine-specific)